MRPARKSLLKTFPLWTALLLLGFFLEFHSDVIRAGFASDEPMNFYHYWAPSLSSVALANLALWTKLIRPMGAIYYLPLYCLFGLNPYPYDLVRIMLLLLDTALFYLLATQLLRSWRAAALATLPVAYQAEMGFLAYTGSFIYDVLCAGFYFGALLFYVHSRRTRGPLGPWRTLLFAALYLGALDSKEMAVSLPVLVLAYELLFTPVDWRRPRELFRQLAPALITGLLTAFYIAGKTLGPGALSAIAAYHPVFAWTGFAVANARFFQDIFYLHTAAAGWVLAAWTALLYLGVRSWRTRGRPRHDPRWLFLLVWVAVTPLPVDFIPDRSGPEVYLVLAGWAMVCGLIICSLARRLARVLVFVPRRATVLAALLACGALYARQTARLDRIYAKGYLDNGTETMQVMEQLRDLRLNPRPGSTIVFLNDPFPDGFTTEFLGYLVWNDHSLHIFLARQTRLPADLLTSADYILGFDGSGFHVRKPAPR